MKKSDSPEGLPLSLTSLPAGGLGLEPENINKAIPYLTTCIYKFWNPLVNFHLSIYHVVLPS